MNKYFDVNEEGFSVRSKLYYNDLKTIKNVIIYGHGFGGHKDNKAAEKFANVVLSKYKTTAVITFDFPGHGKDAVKKITLDKCNDYLRLVINYAQNELKASALFAYATSFGGFITLNYILKNGNPFEKIALRCPAIDMYTTLSGHVMKEDDFIRLAKGKEIQVGFDRKIQLDNAFLNEIKENDLTDKEFLDYADNILIIHGTKDEIVPYNAVKDFAEENVIEFVSIENADHRFIDPLKMDKAIYSILDFFML